MADRPEELFLIDGNSLVYRAFFALPESIATSTGFPTNAIFGFASMLVKILTDYGQVPTVVVWDAGMSGRKDISPDYKAQRSSRPDLLKLQWPHLRPLVEAFGYRNISVEGFEAGQMVKVAGITIGKGFQGGIKRHNFSRGPVSHGSHNVRAPGSIGASAFPARVFKGMRMPGQMGNKRRTQRGLEIASIDADRNLLLIKGSVPGATNSIVEVRTDA